MFMSEASVSEGGNLCSIQLHSAHTSGAEIGVVPKLSVLQQLSATRYVRQQFLVFSLEFRLKKNRILIIVGCQISKYQNVYSLEF